eukprot:6022059-Pyramimonas_sp.AAC.1
MDYCFANAELESEMVSTLAMAQKLGGAVPSIMTTRRGPGKCVNSPAASMLFQGELLDTFSQNRLQELKTVCCSFSLP